MPTVQDIIKLKETKWYAPAIKRWAIHKAVCEKFEAPVEPFENFASEILNALSLNREDTVRDMLAVDEVEPYQPTTRYRQYDAPRQQDMVTGLFYRDYRKGKK